MTAANLYSPDPIPFEPFDDATQAVERLLEIYARNTGFLRSAFQEVLQGRDLRARVRAFYPAVRVAVDTYDPIDTRLSYGHVAEPGIYQTTVTQ
ncbi:MAG: AMP nucleosidase, partial [Bordetella sp.]|nr:AMP nucleosidase [Bordetella sp.]